LAFKTIGQDAGARHHLGKKGLFSNQLFSSKIPKDWKIPANISY